ncbi:sulfatase-like hydrolase/transferase [Pedobacter cryoconitis]|uniref:Sulfatase-like protein n=1 Tax=Pedobacter cryoconitis TaxID=188932 RepID=A0A327SGC5_9SPHI|nr:sulfatase-like hydrolase/transferase [Pedobacter cryoconitis]RAJ28160.1 sulfatase-like protein [Pedobacter cryoconitis]
MGKTIDDWLSRPLFIYSFGFFFLIYKSSQYFASFNPLLFIAFFGGYCLINYSIVWILKKNGIYKYGIGCFIPIWTLVLFPELIIYTAGQFANSSFVRVRYLLICIILLCLLISLIRSRLSDKQALRVNPVLNIFIMILIVVTVFDELQIKLQEDKHKSYLQSRKLLTSTIKNKKDIIWILLDEYASPASLKSQFHFNDPLVDSLKGRGFFVYDSLYTRSDITLYSVNSLFNLDDSIQVSSPMYATDYLNKSIWVKQLTQHGYDFISLEFTKIAGYPKLAYLRMFPDNYFDQILFGTLFTNLMDKITKSDKPFDDYNQQVIRELKLNTHTKRKKPTFIWAHLLIPHPPFYRDAKGKLNESPILDANISPPSTVVEQYTGYLSYANSVVLDILEGIPDWRNKTIIISGDHGARMLVPANDPRRKQTFGAIYYPGMDQKELSKIKYMQQIPFHLH